MKFLVQITEVVVYHVPVEARNEDRASDIATDLIINTRNRDKWVVEVKERDVDFVAVGHAAAEVV